MVKIEAETLNVLEYFKIKQMERILRILERNFLKI